MIKCQNVITIRVEVMANLSDEQAKTSEVHSVELNRVDTLTAAYTHRHMRSPGSHGSRLRAGGSGILGAMGVGPAEGGCPPTPQGSMPGSSGDAGSALESTLKSALF